MADDTKTTAPQQVRGLTIDPEKEYDVQLNKAVTLYGVELGKQNRYHLRGEGVLQIADAIGDIVEGTLK